MGPRYVVRHQGRTALRTGPSQPNQDAAVATLAEFLLGAGLAKFKLPERVEVLDALPLTNVGKVSKKDLRDDVARKIHAESVIEPGSVRA